MMVMWMVMLILLACSLRARAAQDFSYAIDLTYRLDASGTTRVVANYKVTNNQPDRILDLIKIAAPTDEVKNLKATMADGRSIRTATAEKTTANPGYNYKYQEITVDFDTAPAGRGAVLNFTISYDTTELMDNKGPSKAFYVPSLAQIGDNESYTVNVSVPQGFGKLISTGVMPEINGADGNLIRYTFTKPGELKRSTTLIFGDSTVYNADFAFPLTNDSAQTKTMTVTLPPDTSTQKVFIRKLEPAPNATRLDQDGNILADYTVPARTKLVVHTDIAASIRYAEYDLAKGGEMKDIPADLKKNYTGATRYWQTTNPELQKKAVQATAGTDKVVDKVRALHKLTIDTLTYNNEKIKYNIRQGSTKALENPDNAVCLEYSDLMIALLRSQGIPARMPVGYAYAGNLKQSKAVADSLHSWVEAYVPGVGWMNLDPTWGEKFDNFGKSDLDHFAFAIWGVNDARPAAVMTGDQDSDYQYEDTKISYAADFPQATIAGRAKLHQYVLFPGIVMTRYELQAPENVAGDKYAVLLKTGSNRKTYQVGSLAPQQKFAQTVFTLGGNYTAKAELVFVQAGDDGEQTLAAASAEPQWWPMILILLSLSGVAALILVEWWLKRRQTPPAYEPPMAHSSIATNLEAPLPVVEEPAEAKQVHHTKSHHDNSRSSS